MGLNDFKTLFWLEWFHRLWGRLLGVVFLVPLVWFGVRGRLERRIVPRLVGLLLLIGLQGAVGWFMVASGFDPDSTAVSPYRLVAHLSLAVSLFAAVLWTAFSTQEPVPTSIPGGARLKRAAEITLGLVALTILAGGFTAGLHAGLIYNTFPLMDGRLFPEGYADLHPFLLNLFENVTAVQFDHRLLATLTALAAWTTIIMGIRHNARAPLPLGTQRALIAVGTAVSAQYALGIATLLTVVKLPVAATHQACAVLLLASVLALTHTLRGAK
jgi:cytochrome c oxidase assembly protein subunit 15